MNETTESEDTEEGELLVDEGESSEFGQNELIIDEESVDSELMAIHQQSSNNNKPVGYNNDGKLTVESSNHCVKLNSSQNLSLPIGSGKDFQHSTDNTITLTTNDIKLTIEDVSKASFGDLTESIVDRNPSQQNSTISDVERNSKLSPQNLDARKPLFKDADDVKSTKPKNINEASSKKDNLLPPPESIGDLDSDSEDEDSGISGGSYKINWNATLEPPPPHLFTQEAFDKYFDPCKMDAVKLTLFEILQRDVKVHSKETGEKLKVKSTKTNTTQSKKQSDIFENVEEAALVVQTFDQATKYHRVIEEPKLSSISVPDRKWFFKYKEHISKGFKKSSMEEDRFKDLSSRIAQEQRDYMQHLYNCFITNPSEYFFVASSVKSFIKSTNMKRVQDLLSGPKNFYSLKQTINMKQIPPMYTQTRFNHLGTVKAQNDVPELKLPSLNSPLRSPEEPRISVSLQKSDAVKLCEEKNCSFYVHANSLISIMESLVTQTREWLVPVHVSHSEKTGGNIVHLGEPLPRRNISIREANKIYYQFALLQHQKPLRTTDESSSQQMFLCGKKQIIVQSSIDAVEKHSRKTYSISAKVEFQSSLGFETFSITDLCHLWWRSRLSNSDEILCCRVDPRNNCLRRFDTYTREVLYALGCPYNPEQFMNQLHYLFDVLCNSQPGDYMLEHASGNAFFFLFEQKDKGFTTIETKFKDLLNFKNELIMTNQVSTSWLPLNTNIQSRTLENFPCLFKPKIENIEMIALGGKRPKKVKRNVKKKKKHGSGRNFSPLFIETLESKQPEGRLLPPGTEDESQSPVFKNPVSYDEELF